MFFLQCALVGQWNLSHYTHGKTKGQKYFTFLKDKIFKSWTKCYSPQPPPSPPKKKWKKKIKKRKQAIPAMCYLSHLSPQVVDVL